MAEKKNTRTSREAMLLFGKKRDITRLKNQDRDKKNDNGLLEIIFVVFFQG